MSFRFYTLSDFLSAFDPIVETTPMLEFFMIFNFSSKNSYELSQSNSEKVQYIKSGDIKKVQEQDIGQRFL